MLQQTQVERVIPMYHAFLKRFPTPQKLARAKTASVIKQWKGLGYNRRALYLQRTAKAVVQEYNGKFPCDLAALKSLPGIGEYTARAILSFAFEQPVAMMDTNHRKVYSQIFFSRKNYSDAELLKKADALVAHIPKKKVHDWNQALMDFGSTLPKRKQQESGGKKKRIPFRETDRYFRGRLVDLLREKGSVTIQSYRKQYPELTRERTDVIVGKLVADGLILKQKNRILFP